jgi:acetyltransferase-like isoleucine patch superfamily enzyme
LKKILFFLLSPWKWLIYYFSPVPWGIGLANFFFQRILRIHACYSWPVNYTSRVIGDVQIGKNVWKSFAISGCCYIQGGNGIFIGDDTIFAPGVNIISANHSLESLNRWEKCSPIRIGKRCWIGANACILPGVELGNDVVVGAGSVVNKNFPDGSIIVGVPAKIIKMRPKYKINMDCFE